MYSFIGLAAIKQALPYFRKYISRTLESNEYILLNAIFIFIIVATYTFVVQNSTVSRVFDKYANLSLIEIGTMFLLAMVTAFSTMVIFNLDKSQNTPALNSVYLRSIGIIFLMLIGIFIFGESYKPQQLLGIGLIIAGIYLVSTADKKDTFK